MNSQLVASPVDSTSLWYVCRSTGFVLLILFTATIVLGHLTASRNASPAWPRFVTQSLHRNLALLSIVFLLIHLGSPVIEGRFGLRVVDVFVPMVPTHISIWTRCAAAATDIMLLIVYVTLLQIGAGGRFWRMVHLTSYAAWLLCLAHGTGIGTDRVWVLRFDILSVLLVFGSGWYRLTGFRRVAVEERARAVR